MEPTRHISHKKQQNKPHSKSKGKSLGKVEQRRNSMLGKSSIEETRADRLNRQEQLRKRKREALLMQRRGLNFLTEHSERMLDEDTINAVEDEVDNVAPKVVGLLGLSDSCDVHELRGQLVAYCEQLMESQQKKTKKELKAEMKAAAMTDHEEQKMGESNAEADEMRAYIIPNAGATANMSSKKQRVIFRAIDRNDVYSVLDTGKVADMVLIVMSAKNVDESYLKVDPDKYSGALDEQGYRALCMLRSQGTMSLIGVLQHVEDVSSKRQPQVKRLFQRYFVSEFTDKHRFMTVNTMSGDTDINALLRQIAVTYPEKLTWREDRSYMLGKVAEVDQKAKEVVVKGYIRNNLLNVKRLVHLTGIMAQQGFRIKQIEASQDPCPLKLARVEVDQVRSTEMAKSIASSRAASREASRRSSRRGSMDVDDDSGVTGLRKPKARTAGGKVLNPLQVGEERDSGVMEMAPDPFGAEQTYLTEEDIALARERKGSYDEMEQDLPDNGDDAEQIDTNKFDKAVKASQLNAANLESLFDKMQIAVVGDDGKRSESMVSDDDGSDEEGADGDEEEDEHFKEDNKISQKHAKHTDMEARDKEDMDFPDEVETPLKDARKRFQKYRGIRSLKTCEWDAYENLPVEYAKIFRFENIKAEMKQQRELVEQEGLPLNGTYLTLVLAVDEDAAMEELLKKLGQPIVLSTLFPHECKVTTMHFRVRRTLENAEIVPSKALMEFSCGFRRIVVRPTFSMELNAAGKRDKFKYMRFLRKDKSVVATAYCPIFYSPCKVICFTKEAPDVPVKMDIVASGTTMSPDPLKIILKRIILTGYPLRCHKKRATIRWMFFDPKDIKYFRPVELYTQAGLRGHIKDSLGTHGLMKCVFNDHIKHSDVVCMPLYRRVYPKWHPETWIPQHKTEKDQASTMLQSEDKDMSS